MKYLYRSISRFKPQKGALSSVYFSPVRTTDSPKSRFLPRKEHLFPAAVSSGCRSADIHVFRQSSSYRSSRRQCSIVAALHSKKEDEYFTMSSDDGEMENQAELEEKTRLINQVLELQHTLEDLSSRVDGVKEENLKLKSENQVLGQYIENLMSASSVFQTTDTKSKRK
ncbi:hypothetical protein NQZ68_009942 [Dissostichus eleginoides]|nr:hypothetical protein NQZ68_009942 [Dissostichus eleginoides]